jgi:ATP-dependent exoDNAse (exonuclease V) beta subunit
MKLFEHAKPKELDFELEALTLESGRTYTTPDGKKYPSITTVLGEHSKQGIMKWRARVGDKEANKISGRASRRGNELHLVCEQYLKNELTAFQSQKLMPHIKELFLQLRPVLDENVTKVICLEQPLYSHELKVAGRVDGIVEWNGKISVIDYKTSTKLKKDEYIQNYFMQCSAYCEMFEELTGVSIDQFIVAVAVEEENLPQIFIKNKSEYIEPLKKYIRNYHENLLRKI